MMDGWMEFLNLEPNSNPNLAIKPSFDPPKSLQVCGFKYLLVPTKHIGPHKYSGIMQHKNIVILERGSNRCPLKRLTALNLTITAHLNTNILLQKFQHGMSLT